MNLGAVVKTLQRSNSLFRSVFSTVGSFGSAFSIILQDKGRQLHHFCGIMGDFLRSRLHQPCSKIPDVSQRSQFRSQVGVNSLDPENKAELKVTHLR